MAENLCGIGCRVPRVLDEREQESELIVGVPKVMKLPTRVRRTDAFVGSSHSRNIERKRAALGDTATLRRFT